MNGYSLIINLKYQGYLIVLIQFRMYHCIRNLNTYDKTRILKMKYYENVEELADELDISRATLYRRAKLADIKLAEIKQGISDIDLDKLRKSSPIVKNESQGDEIARYKKRIADLSDELKRRDIEIDKIRTDYHDAVSHNNEREKELLTQLSETHELLNQQQRLQLATQELLDSKTKQLEMSTKNEKKGFWARLLGN